MRVLLCVGGDVAAWVNIRCTLKSKARSTRRGPRCAAVCGVSEPANRVVQRGSERWVVREIDAHKVPGARGPRCLICESGDVIRRLWKYPSDWESLDDISLWALCERDVQRLEGDG